MNNYEILGVEYGADIKTCKAAFTKIAKENHPDQNPGDAVKEARFKEASNAFDQLKKGIVDNNPQPQQQRSQNTDSFTFEDIIRSHMGMGGNSKTPINIQGVVSVTLETAIKGGKTTFATQTGRVININGVIHREEPKYKEINIPPNHPLDMPLVFPGEGRNGGDLRIYIKISLDEDIYAIDGKDIHTHVKASVIDLLVGGTVEFTTPTNKKISLKIPPGSQPDIVLRVKNEGLNISDGKGNLMVHLDLETPKISNKNMIELLKIIREQ